MATTGLDQLPSGNWRIRWRDATRVRRTQTFRDRATAEEALRSRLVEVDRARGGLPARRTEDSLAVIARRWLADRTPPEHMDRGLRERRARRVADNRGHLEHHVLPAIGHLRPWEVTPEVLAAFVRRLEGTRTARPGEENRGGRVLSASSVRNVVITLRKMLRDVGHPVSVTVRLPTAAPVWIRDPADVIRVLRAARPAWFRVAAALAVYSGLRRGEVAALRWRSVDFDRGVIHVEGSWNGPTKGNAARPVPMSAELAAVLRRWHTRLKPSPGDRVAAFASGTKVSSYVRRACVAAGVEPVTFHELRHTAATHMAERLPLPAVRAVLGHKDITTTARYAHAAADAVARDPRARLSFRGPGSRRGHGKRRRRRK